MIQSMTGFGQASEFFNNAKIVVQLKTYNSKHFDVSLRVPEVFSMVEDKLRRAIKDRVARGKVNLFIDIQGDLYETKKVKINKTASYHYYNQLKKLKRELGLKGDITIDHLLKCQDVFTQQTSVSSNDKVVKKVCLVLAKALDKLLKNRMEEGRKLHTDFSKRVSVIAKELKVIEQRFPASINAYRKRFKKQISTFNGLVEKNRINAERVEQEVAMFAKDSDVQEEITRLKAHAGGFKKTLSMKGEQGKKLDFICQEMQRETNTIGQKSSDFRISQAVIRIKCEIDRMRQQVQNVL